MRVQGWDSSKEARQPLLTQVVMVIGAQTSFAWLPSHSPDRLSPSEQRAVAGHSSLFK